MEGLSYARTAEGRRRLTRLFMRRGFTTPLAELAKLEALPRVRLVLGGDVVTPLARLACECDRRSLVTHYDSLRSPLAADSRQHLLLAYLLLAVGCWLLAVSFDDLCDAACTDSAATLTNSEP